MEWENNHQPEDEQPEEWQAEGESFAEMLEATFDYTPPRRGEIRSATIMQIETNEIILDMGTTQDAIVTAQDLERLAPEYRASLQVGQEVPVYVLNPSGTEGQLVVSINMGLQQYDWNKARELVESEDVEIGRAHV